MLPRHHPLAVDIDGMGPDHTPTAHWPHATRYLRTAGKPDAPHTPLLETLDHPFKADLFLLTPHVASQHLDPARLRWALDHCTPRGEVFLWTACPALLNPPADNCWLFHTTSITSHPVLLGLAPSHTGGPRYNQDIKPADTMRIYRRGPEVAGAWAAATQATLQLWPSLLSELERLHSTPHDWTLHPAQGSLILKGHTRSAPEEWAGQSPATLASDPANEPALRALAAHPRCHPAAAAAIHGALQRKKASPLRSPPARQRLHTLLADPPPTLRCLHPVAGIDTGAIATAYATRHPDTGALHVTLLGATFSDEPGADATLDDLARCFTIPETPDITTTHAGQYHDNLQRLETLHAHAPMP